MVERLPLSAQTSYAELVERLRLGRIGEFPPGASFVSKQVKNRTYWYVQMPTGGAEGRRQVYVGPDSEALRARIAAHDGLRQDARERQRLVAAVVASGAPRTDRLTGEVVEAMAAAGVFRLRGVLVGTTAFQVYGAHLGVRLPAIAMRTADLDLAQDYGVSVALDDQISGSMLEILRQVRPEFEAVGYPFDPAMTTGYAIGESFRVDILTTNRGAPRDAPSRLPALRTDAVPLTYMDFLLREPVEAGLLHSAGVLVNVPAPARYAVHKLIVSRSRTVNKEKARKDRMQAEQLIGALAEDDPFALREAYAEALGRKALEEGASLLPEAARAALA